MAERKIVTRKGQGILWDEFDRLFEHMCSHFTTGFLPTVRSWSPPTDIYETEVAMVIRMEIAGLGDQDFAVTAHDNIVVVRGIRRQEISPERQHFHLMEIAHGHFERSFALPFQVNLSTTTATYKNGFLNIVVPKEAPEKKDIAIEEGE